MKKEIPGDDLLSHPVARAVPSALAGLTAVFGMGTGVSPPLWSPDTSLSKVGDRSIAVVAIDSSQRSAIARAKREAVCVDVDAITSATSLHGASVRRDLVIVEWDRKVKPSTD
jgi:hypothetical protein